MIDIYDTWQISWEMSQRWFFKDRFMTWKYAVFFGQWVCLDFTTIKIIVFEYQMKMKEKHGSGLSVNIYFCSKILEFTFFLFFHTSRSPPNQKKKKKIFILIHLSTCIYTLYTQVYLIYLFIYTYLYWYLLILSLLLCCTPPLFLPSQFYLFINIFVLQFSPFLFSILSFFSKFLFFSIFPVFPTNMRCTIIFIVFS